MATKKEATEETIETKIKNLDMSKRVTISSIAPWNTGFPNKLSATDTIIQPLGRATVRREEIVEQVNSGNKLLCGITDDIGSHATLYIEDEELRIYLGFDSADGSRKQNVISDDKIKEWFDIKDNNKFEKAILENVITRAEKQYLLKAIERLGFDSYHKIEFCKQNCKFNIFA